jgi:hypothetical protein
MNFYLIQTPKISVFRPWCFIRHWASVSWHFAVVVSVFTWLQASGVAADFPPPLRVPAGIGVNIHFTHAQPGEMEMLADAGFRWVRMDFTWSATEKAKGQYDFSAYDHLLDLCDKHHIRLMAIFDYSNRLYDDDLSPHSDEGVSAFANWAVAAVKHFKGRHVLWEMYNEPNIGFWRPKPDVNAYIKLALAVGEAIKTAEPEEFHCGPALSGTDAAWLESCFKAGLLQYWDAVSVHPYGDEPPETRAKHYEGIRALIDHYAPRGKSIPLLSGEWGYTATRVSAETQGKYLARQILFNISSGIPLGIWYDWHDDGTDPKEGEHHFGTVANAYHRDKNPVYDPKPAYLAARTLTYQLEGFGFSHRAALTNAADFFLVFTKDREKRAVAWTTSGTPHAVYVAFGSGEVSVIDHTGESLPAIRGDEKGLTVNLTDGPKYLVPGSARK